MAVRLKNRLGWDDALDVWGVHGVGGFIGIISLGIFASTTVNFQSGLLEGNSGFFMIQVGAVAIASVYAFVFTYGMLALINYITPVRVSEEQETSGIDHSVHGEKAYDEGVL